MWTCKYVQEMFLSSIVTAKYPIDNFTWWTRCHANMLSPSNYVNLVFLLFFSFNINYGKHPSFVIQQHRLIVLSVYTRPHVCEYNWTADCIRELRCVVVVQDECVLISYQGRTKSFLQMKLHQKYSIRRIRIYQELVLFESSLNSWCKSVYHVSDTTPRTQCLWSALIPHFAVSFIFLYPDCVCSRCVCWVVVRICSCV